MKYTVKALENMLLSIIGELGEHPEKYARNPDKCFTRHRSLTLTTLIGLILLSKSGKSFEPEASIIKYPRRWKKSLTAYPIPSAALPLIPSVVSQLTLGYCHILIKEEYKDVFYTNICEGSVSKRKMNHLGLGRRPKRFIFTW